MTMIPTPFFSVEEKKLWTAENELAFAKTNSFPVRDGHILILPKRVVVSPMDMTPQEMAAIHELAQVETARLGKEFGTTDFTIGFNDGELAGQSVAHAHMHIIPRVNGDTDKDKVRGGILNMFQDLPEYYSEESSDDSEAELTVSDIKAIHKLGNYLCGDLQTQEEFEINESIESYIKQNSPTVIDEKKINSESNVTKLMEFTSKRMLHIENDNEESLTFYDYLAITEDSSFAFQFMYLKDTKKLSCVVLLESEQAEKLQWNEKLEKTSRAFFDSLIVSIGLSDLSKQSQLFFEG